MAFLDSVAVRCSHCGFICDHDRDRRGGHNAISQPSTQLNGFVVADDTTINVDSTAGFPTPAAGETLYVYIHETRA